MQQLAAWLVARPLNAIVVLVVTGALPYLGFVSSVVLVHLVLAQGARIAVIEALVAGGGLAVAGAIGGSSVSVLVLAMLANWLPALVLAVMVRGSRSLTLTLQLSVLIAVGGMAAFLLAVGDPVAFWQNTLVSAADMLRETGRTEQADLLAGELTMFASQLTMLAVIAIWLVYAVAFVLGYLLYRQLPRETADFGRFQDLDLGRVIAFAMAVTSLAGVLAGLNWLQGMAFVLFAAFWLQGLAFLHWAHAAGLLAGFVVAIIYVSLVLPVLNIIMILSLAVLGYADAWFRFRRRLVVL